MRSPVLIIGIPTFRLRGHYFALAMLAYPLAILYVLQYLGLQEVSLPMHREHPWYYLELPDQRYLHQRWPVILLAAGLLVCMLVENSRFGLALMAIRQNELAAEAAGINSRRWKMRALVASGAIAACAGGLYACVLLVLTPDLVFGILVSAQPVVVTLFGGVTSVWGPVIGAAILVPLAELLNAELGNIIPGIQTRHRHGACENSPGDCHLSRPPGRRRASARGDRLRDLSVRRRRPADRDALIAFARERFERLDLLVNNAGMAPRERRDLLEATEESFDELIATNLKGPHFLTQQAARWMAGAPRGPHRLRHLDLRLHRRRVNRAEYCISKAGLSMSVALYAQRLAPRRASRSSRSGPGIIRTDMIAKVEKVYDEKIAAGLLPQRRMGEGSDVANAVRAIADGLLDYSTGQVLNVDGGFHLRSL